MSDGPVAIITAAGGGIGAACARELASRGYRLAIMARSEAVETLSEELGAVPVRGSVAEAGDLERLVATAREHFGRLDAVLANTGHGPGSSEPSGKSYDPDADAHLLDITDEDWHASLDLYLLHVIRVARLATESLKGKGGAIVNISAFGAKEPSWAYPTSSVIRAALSSFTKLYADRYARDGIRINNLLPGYVENWPWSEELIGSIPLGRPAAPAEIARTAAFLLSDDASYITGQNLVVDGGLARTI